MTLDGMKIVVVGGGIGGLAAARALRLLDPLTARQPLLLERERERSPVDGGLSQHRRGRRVRRRLGRAREEEACEEERREGVAAHEGEATCAINGSRVST